MLLKPIYKTLAGVHRRIMFERVHANTRGNSRFEFRVVRCVDGRQDNEPYNQFRKYNYRIDKTRKED